MFKYKRRQTLMVEKRLGEKRNFIQVIMGPRQVGKTTAIQQILDGLSMPYHYAAADLPAPPDTLWIARQWETARARIKDNEPGVLVLDEVQKIRHWSVEVKRLWDEDTRKKRNLKVVLLGSSSMLLQQGLDESLAGRFEIVRFPHWSWIECRDCFGWTLEQYLYFGGYPGGAPLVSDEERWGQYIRDSLIETTISKDILLLTRVEKPALLRQLFVLGCEYGGQILSYQKIMGQLADAGNTTTLAHYQRLLESAFLIQGLQKWSEKMVRQRSSSPKWQPLNTALVTALANRSLADWKTDRESWGRLVEIAVGTHLINDALSSGAKIYYWREGNHEVDFVVSKGKSLVAIEVKSGKMKKALSGLSEFVRRFPVTRTMVVGGEELGLQEFLETTI